MYHSGNRDSTLTALLTSVYRDPAIPIQLSPPIREITYHRNRGLSRAIWGNAVISAHQCRTCAADCAARSQGCGVSVKRAAILLAMSECWTKLADLTEQYEAAKFEEGDPSPH
jgi:hypothetical protein